MTDQQLTDRALDALRVLENPAYQQAIEAMKADVIAAMRDCPIRDKEGLFLLTQILKLTDRFDSIFRGYVEGGKAAQHKINIDQERGESKIKSLLRRAI